MIQSVDIEIIAHATEDEARIAAAASSMFGAEFAMQRLSGHWDNSITLLTATVTGKDADTLARRIASAVPVKDFESRLDKSALHLRLDKVALLHGGFAAGDDVKVRLLMKYEGKKNTLAEFRKIWNPAPGKG